ncbi:MAG: discoidin domain-containing protein [Chloroflexales bacterium]
MGTSRPLIQNLETGELERVATPLLDQAEASTTPSAGLLPRADGTGKLALGWVPVAADGEVSAVKVVRADDSRLGSVAVTFADIAGLLASPFAGAGDLIYANSGAERINVALTSLGASALASSQVYHFYYGFYTPPSRLISGVSPWWLSADGTTVADSWYMVDLGTTEHIAQYRVNQNGESAWAVDLEYSTNGVDWATAVTLTGTTSTVDTGLIGFSGSRVIIARYWRLKGVSGTGRYQIYQFELWRASVAYAPTRLPIGAAGQELTVVSGLPAWADGTVGGDVTGTRAATTVVKLRGRSLATTAPADGQVMTWDDAAQVWTPETPTSGGTVGLPDGGTTGQVLTKTTDADDAVAWADPTGGGGASPASRLYLHGRFR